MGRPFVLATLAIVLVAGFSALAVPAEAGVRSPSTIVVPDGLVIDIEFDPVRPLAYLSRQSAGTILVFSLTTMNFAGEFVAGAPSVAGMDLDPATDRLYVALTGGEGVAVIDLATQTRIAAWGLSGSGVSDVEVGRPGRLYATLTGTWGYGQILDTSNGSVVGTFGTPNSIRGDALLDSSPDHRHLYVAERGDSTGSLYKLDVSTDTVGRLGNNGCAGSLYDIALRDDGGVLYCASSGSPGVRAFRTETMTPAGEYNTGWLPRAVAVTPDGTRVFGGRDAGQGAKLFMYNESSFQPVDSFTTSKNVVDLGVDPSGRYLLVGTDNLGGTFHIEVYDLSLPPNEPPIAAMTISPDPGMVGQPILFSATGSYDPEGRGLTYEWSFGDGMTASGQTNNHLYGGPSAYTVTLVVTDDTGQTATAERLLTVQAGPPTEVVLVPYQHRAGFRLPVPRDWERQEDVAFEGGTIELVLMGPEHNLFRTNIGVETDRDTSVRETPAFLDGVAREVIDSAARDDPTLSVLEAPTRRTVAGHAAVSFAVHFSSDNVAQRMVLVVSDSHDRYWFVILSVDRGWYDGMNMVFEQMVAGFEITLAPPVFGIPSEALPLLCGVAVIVAVLLIVAVVLVRRGKRRLPPPVVPAYVPAPPPMVRCPSCGAHQPSVARFCDRCGRPLATMTASAPYWPPPPPPP